MIFGSRRIRALEAELRLKSAQLDECGRQLDALSAAVDALPFGLLLVDANGVAVRRTPIVGLGGHEEVLLDEAAEAAGRAASLGEGVQRRVDLFGPPQRSFMLRGLPLQPVGALVVIDDVTERVRLDSVRTDFVANISHELKTPVAGLAILAEAISEHDDLSVMQSLASRMVVEAHRASAAIDDLLELSRIELGGAAVRDLVDLGVVISEAVHRVGASASLRDVQVVVEDRFPPKALGDSRQLVSAVANLLDNAVKYSHSGAAVRVSVTTSDGMVDIDVADTGIGIPAKDIDRIFERFYRVDRARSRDTGGTGLGLAIVRHVANNHIGDVLVRSREGEGSTFTLRIPAAEA